MPRTRLVPLAALAAISAACGSKSAAPARSNFKLPSAIVAFYGFTSRDPQKVQPYFAVANEGRDDLTLVDARDNTVLDAPVLIRPLSVSLPGRPAMLASADLGDPTRDPTGETPRPGLLVAVAAGRSSVLQLVKTWAVPAAVDADTTGSGALDLGAEILAIATLPRDTNDAATVGTARLAVALGGQRLAIVTYRRAADGSIVVDKGFVVHGLGFEPADLAVVPPALAVLPEDANSLYVATLDPIGTAGVSGVAHVNVGAPAEPWPVTALGARGPTRLVMAARLRERPDSGEAARARTATTFAGQPTVQRVYAVLDESGCGPARRIDCGIVMLDPTKTASPDGDSIPEDWSGFMPYRAPIQPPGKTIALALSGPPAKLRSDATYTPDVMQVAFQSGTSLTTAVGVAVAETGVVTFLDLGRFDVVNTKSAPVGVAANVTSPPLANRLWIADPDSGEQAKVPAEANGMIDVTPGYAHDEQWVVGFQTPLPQLEQRPAEAWLDGGRVVLAVQNGDGTPGAAGRSPAEVARLYHPALGVHKGDIVAIQANSLDRAAGITTCIGEVPAGTSADFADAATREFETEILDLLPPSAAAHGGSVVLGLRARGPGEPQDPPIPAGWQTCWDAMLSALGTGSLRGLVVTFNAGSGTTNTPPTNNGLLLTGSQIGYAGRPRLRETYALYYKRLPGETIPGTSNRYPDWQYQDEDALAALCPLADWDGSFATYGAAIDCGTGCDRDVCERLVLARKLRRRYHLAENCQSLDGVSTDAACVTRFTSFPTANAYADFPLVNGPALRFQVFHDQKVPQTDLLVRAKQRLLFGTSSGVSALGYTPGGAILQPSGAMAFDRSPYTKDDGYRFLVVYPGNQIADVSPSVWQTSANVLQ